MMDVCQRSTLLISARPADFQPWPPVLKRRHALFFLALCCPELLSDVIVSVNENVYFAHKEEEHSALPLFLHLNLLFQPYWISVPTTTLDCPVTPRWCRQGSRPWSCTVLDWAPSDSSVGPRCSVHYPQAHAQQHTAVKHSHRFTLCLQDIHKNLEQKLAQFHEREDCILYASCFDANAGLFEVCWALNLSPVDREQKTFLQLWCCQ